MEILSKDPLIVEIFAAHRLCDTRAAGFQEFQIAKGVHNVVLGGHVLPVVEDPIADLGLRKALDLFRRFLAQRIHLEIEELEAHPTDGHVCFAAKNDRLGQVAKDLGKTQLLAPGDDR